jgi:hypothetical protein
MSATWIPKNKCLWGVGRWEIPALLSPMHSVWEVWASGRVFGKCPESPLGSSTTYAEFGGDLVPREATGTKSSNLQRIDLNAGTAQSLTLLPGSTLNH